MESPTKEIEEFESTSLKYLQPDQIEKIWLRLRGLRKYKKTSQSYAQTTEGRIDVDCSACVQYVACCFEKTSVGNKYVVAVAKCSAIIDREGREREEMKREGTAKCDRTRDGNPSGK
ncbi:hypothetical protein MHYP_G00238320 [Metynnis hypsauchen]